jgi:hypothetical protein
MRHDNSLEGLSLHSLVSLSQKLSLLISDLSDMEIMEQFSDTLLGERLWWISEFTSLP